MNWTSTALDLLLPDTCVLCRQIQQRRNSHLLCAYCWLSLPRQVYGCRSCALPLTAPGLCGQCQHNPLSSGLCLAPLRYEGDARTLVHQLKYSHGLRAGIVLAEALVQQVLCQYQDNALPECLIPVPLSYRRQVQRGFNQAGWLALRVGGSLGLKLHTNAIRRRHGPPQQILSRRARLGLRADTFNVRGALSYTHVAIIDDVLTTGATVSALSKVLQDGGIAKVDIWVATRAAV